MVNDMQLYVDTGVCYGGFIEAVFQNDLKQAFALADDTNIKNMFAYVNWLHNEAPMACSGSPEAYDAWVDQGGLNGQK